MDITDKANSVLARYSDVLLAAVVIGMVGMMIIPLPTFLLDMLLTANIATAVTLLMVSLYIPSAVHISAFPSILLLTTLFRLALNVSSTRLILLQADAGEVIAAFGNFVVQGNYVVGAVIFLILTIIQFLVIAKGSERVSEVAARFTLDAMPGKQMSIDADLRAGAFDLNEARARRAHVQRESQLYGAMDGAMKFVKGDAIAGIIITSINIIAGMIVGVVQLDMGAGQAASIYTLLTIGDGLVSQIPALLIAMTAGIIVTRVSSEVEDAHLGSDILGQITAHPRALMIAGVMLLAFGVIPGLPTVPFMLLGFGLGFVAYRLGRTEVVEDSEVLVEEVEQEAREQSQHQRLMIPTVVPVTVELGPALTQFVGDRVEWLREMIPSMREGIFYELGVKVPSLRVRTGSSHVEPWGAVISIDEVPVTRCRVNPNSVFLAEAPSSVEAFGLTAVKTKHPITRRVAAWVDVSAKDQLEEAGMRTWDAAGYILIELTACMQKNASEFIGVQETQDLIEQLEGPFPAAVQEVVPKHIGVQELSEILKRLVEEGISIRNLRGILEILADRARGERDAVVLAERVREGMARYITSRFSRANGSVTGYLVDSSIEEMVAGSVRSGEDGTYLALPPDVTRQILDGVGVCVEDDIKAGRAPILLTNQNVRRYIKRIVSLEYPEVVVLGFQELDPAFQIQPMGRVTV